MANLVIDIGNSRSKVAVFADGQISYFETFSHADEIPVETLAAQYKIKKSILSSVSQQADLLEQKLQGISSYLRFSAKAQTVININYRNPQTLGLDRLAAIIGARSIYSRQNCLIIDAGTCITYDAVDQAGNYSGGSISPGINMRFKAMHTFTGRLPLVNADEDFQETLGDDTQSAMVSGVQNGVFFEVLGFIESYKKRYPELQMIICGGDANFFDRRLKNTIFAHTFKTEQHLVLIGLNEVINHYNDKNF